MKRVFSAFRRYFRRSNQQGQSVILLALGFVALAGFVGITTDISLMFVRYAQLSRAVDSAAIAAANQMRQDRSNASVQLAARQFIEFYGLSPESVIVDTCLTTNYTDADLCTDDQAKLVRVRAYFRQPTVFLRLLGVQWFDMWVGATSQTAALDVVIVMDVSEPMAAETTIEDWSKTEKLYDYDDRDLEPPVTNYGVIYRVPYVNEIVIKGKPGANLQDVYDFWQIWEQGAPRFDPLPGLLNRPQIQVNQQLVYYDPSGAGIDWGGNPAPPGRAFAVRYNATRFATGPTTPVTHPRKECRVRFYPSAGNADINRFRGYEKPDGTVVTYLQLLAEVGLPTTELDGFLPTYNYYGCCNDPDGLDGFDDLVCQPFKQVREATFGFLDRIDFLRGDRAAFVTYDRSAFLVNPYPYKSADKEESERHGAMIDDREHAYNTLKNLIGVRAEPYFYQMTDPGIGGDLPIRQWTGMNAGSGPNANIRYDDTYSTSNVDPATGELNPAAINYPVQDNCFIQNASQTYPITLFPNGLINASLPSERPAPTGYSTQGYDSGWKNYYNGRETIITHNTANPSTRLPGPDGYKSDTSYEGWAACRSGNIGAALREANNALLNPNTSRRFGTIWIIVLMSKGGAGASDPVRRGRVPLNAADPYEKVQVNPPVYGQPGEYGAFGLCPMGSPSEPGELVKYDNDTPGDARAATPYCADESVISRHTCDFRPLLTLPNHPSRGKYQSAGVSPMEDIGYLTAGAPGGPDSDSTPDEVELWNKQNDHLYDVDILNPAGTFVVTRPDPSDPTKTIKSEPLPVGGCDPLYDVEDYARDWADYIAIANLGTNSSNTQVPTIFTIGFALDFKVRTGANLVDPTKPVNDPINAQSAQTNVSKLCELNISNCLGEQLLRYIADIGDNNRIDNDYYQDLMNEWYNFKPGYNPGVDLFADGYVGVGTTDGSFGTRDACQYSDTDVNPWLEPTNGHYDNGGGVAGGTAGNKKLEAGELANIWGQLRANVSCGNYYFSPDPQQLQFVFDDIASRMFTRLSR